MNNSIKFLALTILTLTTVSLVNAATITISDGESIQTAIDAAGTQNGDTLSIAGTHNEHIVINKELALVANWAATINWGWTTGTIVSIEANNVTVDGFNITNIEWFGISTKEAGNIGLSNIVIKNNTITNIQAYTDLRESGIGIFVGYMDWYFQYDANYNLLKSWLVAELDYNGLIVDHNTISNIAEGIVAQSIHGGPWSELEFTNNNVSDTIIGRNGGAFYIDGSSYLLIDGNTSDNTYYGINMSSYLYNQPWVEYNTAGGSSHITITNNEFINTKWSHRYDGAGIAIYGGEVSTMLVSGNKLSNNAVSSILLAANDVLSAPYNYFGDSPRTVLAKALINRLRVVLDTSAGAINDDPYYYTETNIRTASNSVTTGDNEATISYTMQEILSNTTWTAGTITIGTGSSTVWVASQAITYGVNVEHGNLWYTGATTFNNLDVGDYNYEINYTTSEGVGTTTTGSFSISLIAYGCITNEYGEAAIYFNTSSGNVDMLSPTDEGDLFPTPKWRSYPGAISAPDFKTFHFEYLWSANPETLDVYYNAPTCAGY